MPKCSVCFAAKVLSLHPSIKINRSECGVQEPWLKPMDRVGNSVKMLYVPEEPSLRARPAGASSSARTRSGGNTLSWPGDCLAQVEVFANFIP